MSVNIKKAIKVAIAMRGISQRDLATAAGLSEASISSIVSRGAPSLKTVERLAKALGMKASELIKFGEE